MVLKNYLKNLRYQKNFTTSNFKNFEVIFKGVT